MFKKGKNLKNQQEKLLLKILDKNKGSFFGKERNFKKINSYIEYKKKVDIYNFDFYNNYFNNFKSYNNLFTNSKIVYLSKTSGTTNKPKLIPQTTLSIKLRKNYLQKLNYNFYKSNPNLYSFGSKALFFPGNPYEGKISNVYFGSISGYLDKIQPFFVKFLFCVPDEISLIKNHELRYYIISLFAIRENLKSIVTPNPSTIVYLEHVIKKNILNLKKDFLNNEISFQVSEEDKEIFEFLNKKFQKKHRKNKKAIEKINNYLLNKNFYELFIKLETIICWKSGSVSYYLPYLEKLFNHEIRIQELGFMSSESSYSIPISKDNCILDIESNFYEFIELKDYNNNKLNKIYLAHQLEKDKKYVLIVTNISGLYRYNQEDIIEVKGFYKNLPIIQFVQKTKYYSSLTGEKISEWEIVEAFRLANLKFKLNAKTFFTFPKKSIKNPKYIFYIQTKLDLDKIFLSSLENFIDNKLKEMNIEYKLKRETKRLNSVQVIILKNDIHKELRELYSFEKLSDSQLKIPKLVSIDKDKKIFENFLKNKI